MSGCLSASLLARLLPLSWSLNDGSTEPLAAVAVCGRGLAVDSPVCLTVFAVSKCEPGCETGEKTLGRKLFYSSSIALSRTLYAEESGGNTGVYIYR